MNLFDVPTTVLYRPVPGVWRLRRNRKVSVPIGSGKYEHPMRLYFFSAKRSFFNPTLEKPLDAWAARDQFLRASTNAELLQFLNGTGSFTLQIGMKGQGFWSFELLRRCQDVFRQFLLIRPPRWSAWLNEQGIAYRQVAVAFMAYSSATADLRWVAKHQVIALNAEDAFSAIYFSIYLDQTRGALFKSCARKDCRKSFELTSLHKRKFCSPYCAHLETVRRSRRKKEETSA